MEIIKKIENINNQPPNPIQDKEWVNYYKSLFNPTTNVRTHSLYSSEQDKDKKCSLDFPFTCKELKRGIFKLKSGKKGGPDLMLNEFIKAGASTMALALVKLFNKILQTGNFPRIWSLSYISSIYKSGDPTDCSNYRGISLTSCLGKLFTSLLQRRLYDFLESHNLLSCNQGGFREKYRTSDHVFILKTLLNKCVLNKKKEYISVLYRF